MDRMAIGRKYITAASAAAYIGAIVMANWLIVHVGFIYVWPGVLAPAGVYCAGLSFPARDVLQRAATSLAGRAAGYAAGIAAIGVTGGITYLISPVLAVASSVTFLASESLDMTVYSALQRRWFTAGVIISSVAAAAADSLLFLYLAHIPYSVALKGQIIGKLEVVFLVGIPVALALRRALPLPQRDGLEAVPA